MPDYTKPLQQRKTYSDTRNCQNEILQIISKKKSKNEVLFENEKDHFLYLLGNSVLSHGSTSCFLKTTNGRIIPFPHIFTLYYLIAEQKSNHLNIYYGGQLYEKSMPISKLWDVLEKRIIYIMPFANEEALHMSAEAPLKEAPTPYEFKAGKKT